MWHNFPRAYDRPPMLPDVNQSKAYWHIGIFIFMFYSCVTLCWGHYSVHCTVWQFCVSAYRSVADVAKGWHIFKWFSLFTSSIILVFWR